MPSHNPRGARPDRTEIAVALSAAGLGLFVLASSFSIDLGTGYDRIGPQFFPGVVALGLIVSGGFLAWEAARRTTHSSDNQDPGTNWRSLGTLIFALGLSPFLLGPLGFILTSALLFWLVARAFESPRPYRDAAVGLLLSASVYFLFTRGLGLVLPPGLLDGVI